MFTSKKKKIFILLGHPNKGTTNSLFADAYEHGARDAGHEVRRINLADLHFDPVLHKGYQVIQELEPDLKTVQEAFKWAEHIVIFYPSWWSTMPALLKGMFDRMWLPYFAFHFHPNGYGWTKLLKHKSARVVVTSDSHPLLARILFGDTTNEIKKGILWFAGISPIKIHKIGPLRGASDERKKNWAKILYRLGAKGY